MKPSQRHAHYAVCGPLALQANVSTHYTLPHHFAIVPHPINPTTIPTPTPPTTTTTTTPASGFFLLVACIPAYFTKKMYWVDVAWPWGLVIIGALAFFLGDGW